MENHDRDIRFMAVSDLLSELSKETMILEIDQQRRIITMLLKLLQDSSQSVQGVVVKCWGPLVHKITDPNALEAIDSLVKLFVDRKVKTEIRDLTSLSIKPFIRECQHSIGPKLVPSVVPKLLECLNQKGEVEEMRLEAMDILNEILGKFLSFVGQLVPLIQTSIMNELNNTNSPIRKKSIVTLGHLANCTNEKEFRQLMEELMGQAEKSANDSTYLLAIGSVCRSGGSRSGFSLHQLVPILLEKSRNSSENENEMREVCLQTAESLLVKCPNEITPYLQGILDLAFQFLKYDPNYAGDEDMTDANDNNEENMDHDSDFDAFDEGYDDEDGNEMEEMDNENDYDYEDDDSWKVRKAAIRVIHTAIDRVVPTYYKHTLSHLISRFNEREENVKMDIFYTFIDLLKQTKSYHVDDENEKKELFQQLQNSVPTIVKSINEQIKGKNVKVKTGCFMLLKELVLTVDNSLSSHLQLLIPNIAQCLQSKGQSSMILEGFSFLRVLLSKTDPLNIILHTNHTNLLIVTVDWEKNEISNFDKFKDHIETLMSPTIVCVDDSYYKISAEALRVCSEIIRVINELINNDVENKRVFDNISTQLFDAIVCKLKAQDIDQEVKEAVIESGGLFLGLLAEKTTGEKKRDAEACMGTIVGKLDNEITRVHAVKAIERVSRSAMNIDNNIDKIMVQLVDFMRKNDRNLRFHSLLTAIALVDKINSKNNTSITIDEFNEKYTISLLDPLSGLLTDSDQQLTILSLQLMIKLINGEHTNQHKLVNSIKDKMINNVLSLIQSPLLQEQTILVITDFLSAISSKNIEIFREIWERLDNIGEANKGASHVINQVSRSLGSVVRALDKSVQDQVIDTLTQRIKNEEKVIVSLHSLGEIGKQMNLQNTSALEVVLACLDTNQEEYKMGASITLGKITMGNISYYLPLLIDKITKKHHEYVLLLHSLREVIASTQLNNSSGNSHIMDILSPCVPILLFNASSEENSIRLVVSECLGRMANLNSTIITNTIIPNLSNESQYVRSSMMVTVKYIVNENMSSELEELISSNITLFLDILKDESLLVKKSTLQSINHILHNKPSLLKNSLSNTTSDNHTYLSLIYTHAIVRPELMREYNIGPFKHWVDDGLEIRKSAYECLYTLSLKMISSINVAEFIGYIAQGFKDQYDIKMLCHIIVSHLTKIARTQIIACIAQLIDPLKATLTSKVKEQAVKQDRDRNEEMISSAIRAIAHIDSIPNIRSCVEWEDFMNQFVRSTEDIKTRFHAEQRMLEKS